MSLAFASSSKGLAVASDLVMRLLGVNAAAALAILAILALRKPVRAAAGARTAYALWLIVPTVMLACLLPPRIVLVPAPRLPAVGPAIAIAPVAGRARTVPAKTRLPAQRFRAGQQPCRDRLSLHLSL